MCGRFTLALDGAGIQQAFPWLKVPEKAISGVKPRYNVAPTQPVAVVPNDSRDTLDYMIWGLIPSWAKDPSIGSRMINARGDTLHEKPSFRTAYKRRRCLILTTGFYEWKKDVANGKEVKTPVLIHMQGHEPFAFAGLWESWRGPDGGELRSCTIITTEANDFLKPIHDRMPVILPPDSYNDWLDPAERSPVSLGAHIQSYPGERMAWYAVSTLVNKPANDSPELIVPVQ